VGERYLFSETIIVGEDQEWSRGVLLDGHKMLYEPQATVGDLLNNMLRKVCRRYSLSSKPDISIVLLTKNGGNLFRECLKMVFRQDTTRQFEVIVIDSGSIDNTLEIASRYPTRLYTIEPWEFLHGRTRNLGADLADGDFVVYLTQDAMPTSPHLARKVDRQLG